MAEESVTGKKPADKDKEAADGDKPAEKESVKVHKEAKPSAKGADGLEAHKEAKPSAKAAEGLETQKEHKVSHKPAAGAAVAPAPKKKAAGHPAAAAKAPKPKVVGKSDIGIDVKPPAKACSDQNCPFHGRLPVRGQILDGIVVSAGMDKSAVIRRERMVFIPKYERFLKRTSRMSVHSPPCIGAAVGDEVTVMECRPLSKTIAFTIVSKKAESKAGTE
jgi:small subunit ribosomal protein S17